MIKNSKQLWRVFEKRRVELERSRRAVCRDAGLSYTTWTMIEKSGGNMSVKTALAIAGALGLRIEVER
ncbi:MAG: helix-turn-helix transcriptional regulator [Paracoccaceae bacterium]|nr:helix-turn-helix transcriptional regulator [Paracoccaceae bacterium]